MVDASLASDLTLVVAVSAVAGIALWALLTRPVSYWRN